MALASMNSSMAGTAGRAMIRDTGGGGGGIAVQHAQPGLRARRGASLSVASTIRPACLLPTIRWVRS
jgi:hypothetical protein